MAAWDSKLREQMALLNTEESLKVSLLCHEGLIVSLAVSTDLTLFVRPPLFLLSILCQRCLLRPGLICAPSSGLSQLYQGRLPVVSQPQEQ